MALSESQLLRLAEACLEGNYSSAGLIHSLSLNTNLPVPVAEHLGVALHRFLSRPNAEESPYAVAEHLKKTAPGLIRHPSVRLTRYAHLVPRFAQSNSDWLAVLNLPVLDDLSQLAAWLKLEPRHLLWFADEAQYNRHAKDAQLHHYHYRLMSQGDKKRLLEVPKPRLKAIQQHIHHAILQDLPVYAAAHGFVKGRSVVSAVQRHSGKAYVVTADIQHFFHAISAERVRRLFIKLGYSPQVATWLTGLCVTSTPSSIYRSLPLSKPQQQQLARPHLAQGAPTSPMLSNLICYNIDRKLTQLAQHAGFTYDRYADDLIFSSNHANLSDCRSLLHALADALQTEDFRLNRRKTRILSQARRQSWLGLVLNAKPQISRSTYDRLKAEVHNCQRYGLASQNHSGHPDYRAHLQGRIEWLRHFAPERAERLHDKLAQARG